MLALGCLTLVFAARAARGHSHLGDAFLPGGDSDPPHWYETVGFYVYAYAMGKLAVWCATASAVLVKWHLRSICHLLLYVLGALVVTWAGGPPGNLWALGLCVPLVLGCFERVGLGWRTCALLGATLVSASSALLIYCVPQSPDEHLAYRSESLRTTIHASGKFAVGWMGDAILQVIYPWALLVLVVPLVYLLVRFVLDVRRLRAGSRRAGATWGALLTTALLVAVALGVARGRYDTPWSSRYCALEVPIAVVLYLLLVRCAAPKELLGCLALGMAICVGWNQPTAARRTARFLRSPTGEGA